MKNLEKRCNLMFLYSLNVLSCRLNFRIRLISDGGQLRWTEGGCELELQSGTCRAVSLINGP